MNIVETLWSLSALIGLLAAATFIVGYDFKTGGSWCKNRMGRHLMGLISAIGLLLFLLMWTMVVGSVPRFIWIGAMLLLGIQLIERCLLLFTRRWRSDSEPASETTIQTRREFRG